MNCVCNRQVKPAFIQTDAVRVRVMKQEWRNEEDKTGLFIFNKELLSVLLSGCNCLADIQCSIILSDH